MKRPSTEIARRIARAFGMKGSEFLRYVEELSAPLPEEDRPPQAVQMPLKRSRSLALFGNDQAPQGRPAPGRGPMANGQEERNNLAVNELLVIARRLSGEDRLALLQLARHLLHRRPAEARRAQG